MRGSPRPCSTDKRAKAPKAVTAAASDTDLPANTLTFSLTAAPSGAAIGSSTGAFSWTPTAGQVGTHTFAVCVSDGTAQDCGTITVTVTGSNTPPVVNTIGNRSVNELATLTFTATAIDPNVPPQVLTWSLSGAPSGATIDPGTGAFSWTPSEVQGPGPFPFQVCVTDGVAADCGPVTVTVNEVNVAPVLSPSSPKVDEIVAFPTIPLMGLFRLRSRSGQPTKGCLQGLR